MSKRVLALLGITLAVLVLTPACYAADNPWLGYYKGSQLLGHEVVESEMVISTYFGPQQESAYQEILDVMKALCLKKKGVALINVDMIPAIGEVRMPTGNAGQAKVASQGLHVRGISDCVLKIK